MTGLGVGLEILRPWPVKILVDHVLGPQPRPADAAPVLRWLPGASGPGYLRPYMRDLRVVLLITGLGVAIEVVRPWR